MFDFVWNVLTRSRHHGVDDHIACGCTTFISAISGTGSLTGSSSSAATICAVCTVRAGTVCTGIDAGVSISLPQLVSYNRIFF